MYKVDSIGVVTHPGYYLILDWYNVVYVLYLCIIQIFSFFVWQLTDDLLAKFKSFMYKYALTVTTAFFTILTSIRS